MRGPPFQPPFARRCSRGCPPEPCRRGRRRRLAGTEPWRTACVVVVSLTRRSRWIDTSRVPRRSWWKPPARSRTARSRRSLTGLASRVRRGHDIGEQEPPDGFVAAPGRGATFRAPSRTRSPTPGRRGASATEIRRARCTVSDRSTSTRELDRYGLRPSLLVRRQRSGGNHTCVPTRCRWGAFARAAPRDSAAPLGSASRGGGTRLNGPSLLSTRTRPDDRIRWRDPPGPACPAARLRLRPLRPRPGCTTATRSTSG